MQIIRTISAESLDLGHVSFLEACRDVPFDIKRVYFSYGVKPELERGKHAHKKLEQFLICIKGSIEVLLDNGLGEVSNVTLNRPDQGLPLPPGIWHTMKWLEEGSVLLVLASDYYDESDYIRNYADFLSWIKNT